MNVFMDEQEQNLKGSQLHVCLCLKDSTEMILLSNFCCWSFFFFFFNLSNNVAGRKNFAPTASHPMISIDRVTFYISLSSATSKLPGSLSNLSLKFFDQVIEQ